MESVEKRARKLHALTTIAVGFDELPRDAKDLMGRLEFWKARGLSEQSPTQEDFYSAARIELGIR